MDGFLGVLGECTVYMRYATLRYASVLQEVRYAQCNRYMWAFVVDGRQMGTIKGASTVRENSVALLSLPLLSPNFRSCPALVFPQPPFRFSFFVFRFAVDYSGVLKYLTSSQYLPSLEPRSISQHTTCLGYVCAILSYKFLIYRRRFYNVLQVGTQIVQGLCRNPEVPFLPRRGGTGL